MNVNCQDEIGMSRHTPKSRKTLKGMIIESKDGLKQRFDEILETINSRDSLLEGLDEQIFNA